MNTEKKHIFWLVLFRLIAITSILVTVLIIQFSTSAFFPIIPFYGLVLFVYFLSLVYFLLYDLLQKNYVFQGYLQILFDLLLISALVYISGGLSGSFYFLYVFSIIAASIVLSNRAAYLTAALAAIFFGLMVDGMYFGIIPYFSPEQHRELSVGLVLFTIFLAWSVFFLIAFLANHLTGSLRKTREELHLAQKGLEIKERLAAAGRISAQLAHEVRNPLTAISGTVQLLKDELVLNEEQKKLMNIVLKESARVTQSIEQFLDLASPGKQAFTNFDFAEALGEILAMLRASGELNGRYRVEGNHTSAKISYYGNANQFKQIFWNLIRNSLKAMPSGGTLTIDFFKDKKREVRLRFADTGRGLSEEEKKHLFEPFYSGFDNGRGLGMTTVRRTVDDYEGKIQVKSELRKGTEFIITLPIRAVKSRAVSLGYS